MTVEKNQQMPEAHRAWFKSYDYWVPRHVNYPHQWVYRFLEMAALRNPDRLAIIFYERQINFRELKAQAERLGAALAEMGLGKGDRIGLMLPNCPQYLIAFFASQRLGAVSVGMNPQYVGREVSFMANDAGLKAIFTLDTLLPNVQSVWAETPLQHVVYTNLMDYSGLDGSGQVEAAKNETAGLHSFASLMERGESAPMPAFPPIEAEADIAALQYTGGTTGVPKAAMLTHYNLVANTLQGYHWGKEYEHDEPIRVLCAIPVFHSYGMTSVMLRCAHSRGTLILLPRFNIDEMLEAVERHKPTHFPGVPALFAALLQHPKVQAGAMRDIKFFGSGSAPLPLEILFRFAAVTNGTFGEGYGLSEASPQTHGNPSFNVSKPGSVGLPIPDTDCKIIRLDDPTQEVEPGEEGELLIRGPQVMKGYWNKPEETALALRDGWLFTGDIARMDSDGYFYIVERKKDMIIVGGLNVYPAEVENALYRHPAVLEAAAVGMPHEIKGETVKAFVVLKPGQSATAEEIIEHCQGEIARYKLPTVVEFLPALPRSAVGKVLRNKLRS